MWSHLSHKEARGDWGKKKPAHLSLYGNVYLCFKNLHLSDTEKIGFKEIQQRPGWPFFQGIDIILPFKQGSFAGRYFQKRND